MANISSETAQAYLAAGLSCLPAARAKKHPTVGSWKTWAERLPTQVEVSAWFANKQDAICVVAGAVSGNLECLDFDNKGELFAAWMERVNTGLLGRLVVEQTPSGGYHVLYRTDRPVDGNLKLARGTRGGKLVTLIEIRGEGGLFLCSPTDGYLLQQGSFIEIPTINAEARETLLNAARALDETPAQPLPFAPRSATVGQESAFLARPGDDFTARGDIRPYLTVAGWQMIGTKPDGNELWRRPGKNSGGHSATYDGHVLYVFSSNAAPFESERGYNGFQVYALLEHRGDFTAAARALLDKGYGQTLDPMLGVDVSHLNVKSSVTAGNTVGGALTGHASTLAASGVQPSPVGAVPLVEPEDIPIDELVGKYPKLRPVLIHGFLRLGETMNIIAPPKTGKSWLVTDLALAVVTGTPWFGFPCEQGRVLIIDNELHPETSASRIPKVIAARGFELGKVGKNISIVNQRGRLKTIEDIACHIERYKSQGYKMIIIDAFYRAMPRGVDENDNGAIVDVYNLLDKYAHEIGCAFVLIHHTSKGNQSLKAVTDVGSGAGSQSRAADTHVVLRRHKEKDVVVMESVVRSFPSVDPICLRWNWPLWDRADELNPEELDGKAEMRPRRTSGTEEVVEIESLVERVRTLVNPAAPEPKTSFILKIQKTFDLARSKARTVFEEAVAAGYVKCEKPESGASSFNPTKLVVLGDRKPETEDDEDDE